MRAAIVSSPAGPDAVEIRDVPEPEATDGQVLVDVRAVGISFPDLLLSKGEYQVRPEPPFALGVDFAGTRRDTGERVACVLPFGGAAEVVAADPDSVFALPDQVSFEAAAALPMNYLTAQFTLAERAGLQPGETVLVNGAAGGVGTATIQVAKGYGARVIALTSTQPKADLARRVGADEALVMGEDFREDVKRLTGGQGVDVLVDVVGGEHFTDYLRVLGAQGRLMVVGFTGRSIPEVKVNRLLLNNIDVRGVGWGAYAMARPGFMQQQWAELLPMLESGVVDPPVDDVRPIEAFGAALRDMDERRTLGKTVLTM
ncbi:NADPH:quinone oxidoreductase family protein [Nocardioides mangrovicus]|uniref:NADPH:quinone oxidoreductase family protein n=1 Tax=Nocardioides mangrovicus TaxID=2478913 RepID=A0A3L8P0E7_9ACTN|nr:NADPH:quinone oxidoreductase family protein [Nocardioides mangrovicus]RLV48049.1 NADPH:quinone oxidoreductase family protein [Nocardioides mangrovicus]